MEKHSKGKWSSISRARKRHTCKCEILSRAKRTIYKYQRVKDNELSYIGGDNWAGGGQNGQNNFGSSSEARHDVESLVYIFIEDCLSDLDSEGQVDVPIVKLYLSWLRPTAI